MRVPFVSRRGGYPGFPHFDRVHSSEPTADGVELHPENYIMKSMLCGRLVPDEGRRMKQKSKHRKSKRWDRGKNMDGIAILRSYRFDCFCRSNEITVFFFGLAIFCL